MDAAPETRLWSIDDWCAAAHLSRGWYYLTPPASRPRSVKLGRALRIVESPREFAERVARLQGEKRAA